MPNPASKLSSKIDINITRAQWLQETGRGILKPRSRELKEIDEALRQYEAAVSEYGRDWSAYEARIALEAWKKKHKDWKSSERNRTRLIEKLDFQLPPLKRNDSKVYAATGESLRQGVLFFLKNVTTEKAPRDLVGFVNDNVESAADVQIGVQTAKNSNWQFRGGRFYDEKNVSSSFLDDVHERVGEFLKGLADSFRITVPIDQLEEFINEGISTILSMVPQLIIDVLGAIAGQISTIVGAIKGLAEAGRAAVGLWKTRYLSDAVLAGAPSDLINSIRDQIRDYRNSKVKEVIRNAVMTGLAAIPAAGPFVSAIAKALTTIYDFIQGAFTHLMSLHRMKQVAKQAAEHWKNNLWAREGEFREWFLTVIKDLPIVTSYCLTMPMTGSYYGFLTLITTDGSEFGFKQLEHNYAMFNDVKSWARQFIDESGLKLDSENDLVAHSILCARGLSDEWEDRRAGISSRMRFIKAQLSSLVTVAYGHVDASMEAVAEP